MLDEINEMYITMKEQQMFKKISIKAIRPQKCPVSADLRVRRLTHGSAFLVFFFCYETMSNCNQHCWMDRISAVLCYHKEV